MPLADEASGMDRVVESDHDARPLAGHRRGDGDRVSQVARPVCGDRVRRAHRTRDHDRRSGPQEELERERQLLNRVGALGDDKRLGARLHLRLDQLREPPDVHEREIRTRLRSDRVDGDAASLVWRRYRDEVSAIKVGLAPSAPVIAIVPPSASKLIFDVRLMSRRG